jgi:hypothetical protein
MLPFTLLFRTILLETIWIFAMFQEQIIMFMQHAIRIYDQSNPGIISEVGNA